MPIQKTFFTILLFAGLCGFAEPAYAQTVKVTYWMEMLPGDDVKISASTDQHEAANSVLASLNDFMANKREVYTLLHAGGKSYFTYDTLILLGPSPVEFRHEHGGVDHYTDFQEGYTYRVMPALGGQVVREPLDQLSDWQLEEGTRLIGDYVCRKATRELDSGLLLTAWYAEAIPVPDGPRGYHGLPGLILEVETENLRMTMHELTILPLETDTIEMPESDEYLSEAEMWDQLQPVIRRQRATND